MNTIYEKLKSIITVYLPEDVEVNDITKDSHLMNELNINSAHLVDIVLDIEDEFNIEISNDDIEQMQTVEDAIQAIERKLKD
ncbi:MULTISPECIES: acyl carrier protein [Croceibacter]|jgi:acyl carrier protein|uniref:Acyl carrier protein n=1 Tax=Croceibacter atlanticus (strain ATCC BAA-628 / JCM 21780 / CIP 108009 / IAM 15332 / KCTC 12090 / HTCC2559) TaxID=216432 RepID=A3U9Q0_CROAH|nr:MULTISPECIES: acyl carrier protein [Croceibacter]EAP86536.1 acyl carrier protein [Croceibacter atlanticus HTCC2559]MBG26227.1 acyl carrier protein [Croceibacter sp.]|tara:strand:+ start:1051 stop:1296 length:246 start_codon:yes stop_codon:yes gene_type:complete